MSLSTWADPEILLHVGFGRRPAVQARVCVDERQILALLGRETFCGRHTPDIRFSRSLVPRLPLRTNRRFCQLPPPITLDSRAMSAAAPAKSQPRNGAGEIFITAAGEIAGETVSAANRFEHETGKPRDDGALAFLLHLIVSLKSTG